MDNGYDPSNQEDVYLLITAVIADFDMVAQDLRNKELDDPSGWTARRLRTMNHRNGDFDLAVQRILEGVARFLEASD